MNMQFKASAECLQQVLHRSVARARFRLLRAPVTADGYDDGPAQAGSLEAVVRKFLGADGTGLLSAEAEVIAILKKKRRRPLTSAQVFVEGEQVLLKTGGLRSMY